MRFDEVRQRFRRPILTLLHAGIGGCIDKPYKAWCSPDDALRDDGSETTLVETVQATWEAASSRTGHPEQMPTHAARS